MGSCPASFSGINGSCFSTCPSDKGFEFQSPGGQPRCVYKDRPEFFVNLFPVQMVPNGGQIIPNLTVASLQARDGVLYAQYKTEEERVLAELAILAERIGRGNQLNDAFQNLQYAENVRDEAPDAYQQARSLYYILKEGDTWKEKERERLLKAEVEPIAAKFIESKTSALRQYENQRKTVDVVNGLKDKVLSLKDEVKYAADTFKEQLDKVQDAINKKRRNRTADTPISFWDWLDTILNVIIVGSLLYVAYLVYKKFSTSLPVSQPAVILRG
jgi:hypothetical protein